MSAAVAVDLDGVLGDTHGLWQAFLEDVSRRFKTIAKLDPAALSGDRAAAAAELDRWATEGVGDWRAALARFSEDHAPVYLRPSADASAALRELARSGYRIGVFTDAPEELAHVALAHLGAARRVESLEAGDGALERLLERFGAETVVAKTPADLAKITSGGAQATR